MGNYETDAEVIDVETKDTATLATLNQWREIQKVTGPHLCLASSKSFLGKLLGFINPSTHVNTFLDSKWARGQSRWGLSFAWGKLDGEGDFNQRVLPAILTDPKTGVSDPYSRWKDIEYCHFWGNESLADSLLLGRVPLVVGVNYLGGTGRDHYIAILRSSNFRLWAVDPWGDSNWRSAIELPMDSSFLGLNDLG